MQITGLIIAKTHYNDTFVNLVDNGEVVLFTKSATIKGDYQILPKTVLWELLNKAHPVHRQEFINKFKLGKQQLLMRFALPVMKWITKNP